MDERELRFTVARARRMLYREGCDSGIAGHVSARTPAGTTFLMSPFEYFDQTVPVDLVLFPVGAPPAGEGLAAVSPAVQFHAAIYERRPDVASVVHTHGRFTGAVSSTGRPVGMYNAVSTLFAGRQSVYVDDGSLPSAHGPAVADALGDGTVVFIKNHGAVIVGSTVEDATVLAMALELACRFQVDSVLLGGTEIDEREVRQAQTDYDAYFCGATWAANLRRLRASDPDLFD
jgi:L-fuculose-phosphate aldolase